MNFARTNLSLLLARQNRQAAQRGADAVCQRTLPRVASYVAGWRAGSVAVPAAAPTGAASSAASLRVGQTFELVGALAMMAAFIVLALFG